MVLVGRGVLLDRREGIGRLTPFLKGGPKTVERFGVIRPERERPLVAGNRVVPKLLLEKRVAEIGVVIRVPRLEYDCAPEGRCSFLRLAVLQQRIAEIVVGFGIVRAKLNGLTEPQAGIIPPPACQQCHTQAVQRLGIGGAELKSSLVTRDGVTRGAEPRELVAQVES